MLLARPCIGRTTSGYGRRKHPVTGVWSGHHGVDIAPRVVDLSNPSIPIFAAADGKVTRRYADKQFGTYGNCLILRHTINGQTYETLYAHLKSFDVKQGQAVKKGQRIGLMGSTGRVTGRHLHFEVHKPTWNNAYSGEQDPTKYFTLVPALGAIGSDVIEVQQLLIKHGYKITADGHFGIATEKALKDFQKKRNLSVDGLSGPSTLSELKKEPSVNSSVSNTTQEAIKKETEEEKLNLTQRQREEMAAMFEKAREKGIFQSKEEITNDAGKHEENILNGTMTVSTAFYLLGVIAGANMNDGKRIL